MSDTLKIDRALLERLTPEDPCYAHNGTIMVCWFCDRDNGHDELRPSDHADDCPWVAARRLLEAPVRAVLEVHVEEPPARVIVVPIEGPMRR